VEPNNIGVMTAIVGVLGFAFAVFRYIAGIRDSLSTRIAAHKDTLATLVSTETEKLKAKGEASAEQTRLMIEAVREAEARSRSELASNLQSALAEVRRDTRALDEKMTSMRVEMIRRADLTEAINGVLAALDRQEKRFEAIVLKGRP
jgi:regulator of protease activity HflC (stomatin/prohibitin superfamily)